LFPPVSPCIPVGGPCFSANTDLAAPLKARHTRGKDMKNICLKEVEASTPDVDRMEAVRDWLREQEARKAGVSRAVAGRR